jgi:hypothetical protein
LSAITEVFTGVDSVVLRSLFESWVNRLKWMIRHEGKYYTQQKGNKRHSFKISRGNERIQIYGPLY